MATNLTGRRFSQRPEEGFDPLERFDIERHKNEAIQRLEDAGIPAREILAEHPGGSWLRRYVLDGRAGGLMFSGKGNAGDSPEGLAARIIELCIQLQARPAGRDARFSRLDMSAAYRLGRLVTLADAYNMIIEPAKKAGRKSAKSRAPKWWNDGEGGGIEKTVREMRARGRSDNDIAEKLHRKAGVAARTIRERIRMELDPR